MLNFVIILSSPERESTNRHLTSVLQRVRTVGIALLLLLGFSFALDNAPATLDRGYRNLYDLDFDRAQQEFSAWQQMNPSDPMGPVSKAAGLLFEEFARLGHVATGPPSFPRP